MLQKLPNKTLYRKRNRWDPKKIYKNAKRVDKSKDICLLDNLSEKYFLINGDFFTVQYQNEKLPRSQPYLLFHEILLVGSLAFFFHFPTEEGKAS